MPKAVSAPAWPSVQGHQPQMTMYGHPMYGFAPPGMMLPPGDGRSQRGFGRRVRQSRRSRSRSRRRRSSRSDSRSDRNTRDKRRHKRSRKARDRRRRSASESQSESELQPEILALFDNNNPYANADSISRSTSVMKKVPKAGVAQTARPKRAYVCGLLSSLPQCSHLPT